MQFDLFVLMAQVSDAGAGLNADALAECVGKHGRAAGQTTQALAVDDGVEQCQQGGGWPGQ